MKMPASEYNTFYRVVRDWSGTKEDLQRLYDEVFRAYEDGHEILERVESMYQHRFSGMNTH